MSKLGYTWYPKDWTNSESVFQLNLEQRGLYRELIDMAMLNDNKTIINMPVWCRKWDISKDKLKACLGQLSHLNLITIKGGKLFIPSCEPRLNLVRGGKKGGTKSKPTPKPTPKGDSNQRETKTKLKGKESEIETNNHKVYYFDIDYLKEEKLIEKLKGNLKITDEQFTKGYEEFIITNYLEPLDIEKYDKAKAHFLNWMKKKIVEWIGKPMETKAEALARKQKDALTQR